MVTAAHQFPTGVVLGARRRADLIEWAERGDRLIIEDDYDAELGGEPVGALQGLAPDRVLYIGSASKRLTPGMRLGWMLPPSWMSWALISAKAIEDAGSESSGQLALADFIARGELGRHLRRMRLRYARRREALLGCTRASSFRTGVRGPPAADCTRWSSCPPASTSRRCSRPPPATAWASRACRCTATPATARRAWCSGTRIWRRRRSSGGCG